MTETTDLEVFNEVTTAKPDLLEAPVLETTTAPVVEAKPAPIAEPDHRVPLSELIAERKSRQALEADLALLRREQASAREEQARRERESTKKPDMFEDPSQFVRQEMDQGLQRDRAAAIYNAKLIAEARFTEEKVNAAQSAFDQAVTTGQIHPADQARVLGSPNPFAEAVKWHQEQTVRSTVGNDLGAYRAKLRAELLADPEFRKEADAAWRQAAGAAPGAVIRSPVPSTPSLSRVGAAALPSQTEADVPDDELFRQTTARKRR